MNIPKRHRPVIWRRISTWCFSAVVAFACTTTAQKAAAHGTHAQIQSPAYEDRICRSVAIHVEKTRVEFPYVHVAIRPALDGMIYVSHSEDGGHEHTEDEVWAGLIALSDRGYAQDIDVSDWRRGQYQIEVRLVGDYANNVRYRSFKKRSAWNPMCWFEGL